MKNLISRRSAMALTGAALAASCVDNKVLSQSETGPLTAEGTGSWSPGVPLPFPAQEIYPCAHNGALHLAGGFVAENGGITGPTADGFLYPPGSPSWIPFAPLPVARHHPHLVSFAGTLLAMAGFESPSAATGWTMQKSIWALHSQKISPEDLGVDVPATVDPESIGQMRILSWDASAELPAPCAEAVVGMTGDGILHLAGGRTPKGEANAVWNDHTDTDHHFVLADLNGAWENAAPCLSKRNSAAGDVIDGNLHVVGGRTVGGGNVATHEVYDHREDRWRTAAPMPQAQGGLAAAAVGGKLYVFGGEYFSDGGGVYPESWAYDPATDSWAALPDMPNPRHGLGAVALDGKIYVIGGALQASGVDTSAIVDIFTPAS